MKGDELSSKFLQKYIAFARVWMTKLSEEAIDILTHAWVEMRRLESCSGGNKAVRVLPITIRSFESLVRLATAHAKLRLSEEVLAYDCEVAIKLMKYTLWGDDDNDSELYATRYLKKRGEVKGNDVDGSSVGNKTDENDRVVTKSGYDVKVKATDDDEHRVKEESK